MIKIKEHDEYDVWCDNCRKVFTFDSPEDLKKETKPDSLINPMYSVICPSCGKEIWFDGISGFTLPDEFTKQVKEKTKHPTVVTKTDDEALAIIEDCSKKMPKSFEECDW